MKNNSVNACRRPDKFSQRIVSRIWQENVSENNSYLVEKCRCHGYSLEDLIVKRSFSDVIYLLFRGELPNQREGRLLEKLSIAFINPGPRHPATRAAMTAAVSKSDPAHILPVALTVMAGNHLGAGEIEAAMRFLRRSYKKSPAQLVSKLFEQQAENFNCQKDDHPVPGFGSRFGDIDPLPQRLANMFVELAPADHSCLRWGNGFAEQLQQYNMGWLSTGVVAATLADLGFQPRAGAGLFQFISSPGLLAHGLEMANKPLTAMPFAKDEDYILEYETT